MKNKENKGGEITRKNLRNFVEMKDINVQSDRPTKHKAHQIELEPNSEKQDTLLEEQKHGEE